MQKAAQAIVQEVILKNYSAFKVEHNQGIAERITQPLGGKLAPSIAGRIDDEVRGQHTSTSTLHLQTPPAPRSRRRGRAPPRRHRRRSRKPFYLKPAADNNPQNRYGMTGLGLAN